MENYADFSNAELNPPELETKPASTEAQVAATKALEDIRSRSFSARHPELGKMVNCQVCGLRHRAIQKCEQKFKELYIEEDLDTGEKTIIYASAVQPKGVEIPSQISAQQPTVKQVVGAATFKKKRLRPHLNRRKLQFVELVRSFLPDEFDEIDLRKARTRARFILAERFGRYNILPPVKNVKQPSPLAGTPA